MVIYHSQILSVSYVPDNNLLHLTCTGSVTSRDLKSCYRRALVFAKRNQVKHWLFDFSRHYNLSENDNKWLGTSFFPNLMIALGPENYIGMVVPKLTYRKMYQEVGQAGMRTYNNFIIMNTFCSSPKATRWLLKQTGGDSFISL